MSETDFEYFEGTKTIQHDDGSTTYVTTYHEPYVEPLTPKETAAVLGITVAMVVGAVSLPFVVERCMEWSDHRREVRRLKREKKIADLASSEKTD
jgi:Na+(H+)/acetate symporter ActP